MVATIFFSWSFDAAGKWRCTYILPTACPSAAFVASTARFQRSCCCVVPLSTLPYNEKRSSSNALGSTPLVRTTARNMR